MQEVVANCEDFCKVYGRIPYFYIAGGDQGEGGLSGQGHRTGNQRKGARHMTQEERRIFLIESLLKEQLRFGRNKIPADAQAQRDLLRSLMNVRMPKPISRKFLEIQDDYLKERNRERGITDVSDLIPVSSDPRLFVWQGDITTLRCDAIVNACNSQMLGCFSPLHACIDNFIHTYTGVQLRLKNYVWLQPPGKIHPSHRRPYRPMDSDRDRRKTAGVLLFGMFETGGRARRGKCCFLLYFHGGISFPTETGGGDRRSYD